MASTLQPPSMTSITGACGHHLPADCVCAHVRKRKVKVSSKQIRVQSHCQLHNKLVRELWGRKRRSEFINEDFFF